MAHPRDIRDGNSRTLRHGMTLVELLMVIGIMTLLLAVAIPIVRPAFQDRQLREASRQVNSFLAGAKARAAETGRPVGVWIETLGAGDLAGTGNEPKYAMRLYLAEVSPGFTGDVLGARATVQLAAGATVGQLYFGNADGTNLLPASPILSQLLLDGERFYIRFDHKGPVYTGLRSGTIFEIEVPNGIAPPGTEHPPNHYGTRPGLTYEITRFPSKSIVSPLTLPGDAVIDLSVSGLGVGSDTYAFLNAVPGTPVMIMFTPQGQTGEVYVNYTPYIPAGSVYLMIGRRAKVVLPDITPEFADPELSNVADPTNFWLTINHRTGTITTEDNAATALDSTILPLNRIKAAREFARGSRQKGGR